MPNILSQLRQLNPRHQSAVDQSLHLHDVTPVAAEINLDSLEVIRWAPVWMTRAERLLLYTLIFTLRPLRYLEIGTFQGGSALLVTAAMDALDSPGQLVCVDPEPHIADENWQRLEHRTTLLKGYSPDILPQAQKAAGGAFDFVLIDGDHTYKGALRDAEGVMPYLANGAYVLFHDSLFEEVARAINKFAAKYQHQLTDFGTLTREITTEERANGEVVQWGGLRLMQIRQA